LPSTPPRRYRAATGRRVAAGPARPFEPDAVSPLTVNRLSVYLRSLRQLEEQGVRRISSQQLGRRFHLSPTQIRKDLAQFGEFGVRGQGYEVARLAEHLAALLQLDRTHRLVIVGMGSLGTALARVPAFNSGSFAVVAGFDSDPAKVGATVGSVRVHPMSSLVEVARAAAAEMAVLAVPAAAAQAAFEAVAAAGVLAVLNFAPVSLPSRPGCRVKNVDLRIQLEELVFFLASPEESTGGAGGAV
jgi:redox-sensing transcriptional repressor